jgi:Na+/melibiose symporter-like transporter
MKERKGNKRGIVSEYLPWILIAIAILAIVLIAVFLLREEGATLIEKIKNLFVGR